MPREMSLKSPTGSHTIRTFFTSYWPLTADDTPYHKPDPRVFEPALAWLKTQEVIPEEVTYIGDGLHDRSAALGAGFSFLGVETGLVSAEQFAEHSSRSIPTIADLMPRSND